MQKKDLIPDWQRKMYAAIRKAIEESKYDMVNVYLKLEQVSKGYLASGEMQEGDEIKIPLENKITLIQRFYNNYSTLEAIGKNRSQMLIKDIDSYKKEYGKLDALTLGLEQSDLGIGPHYPEKFKRDLADMKPGQMFIYGTGAAYLCIGSSNEHVQLKRLIERGKCPKWDDIDISDSISIYFNNEIAVQNFYSKIRSRAIDNIKSRWQILTTAQEAVQRINAGLSGKVKKFQIGPNTVHAKKGVFTNEIRWYDEKGRRIPQENMLILLGWYENAPVITEYKREKDDPINAFDDEIVQGEVDKLCAEHDFEEAARCMMNYCIINNQELSINMSSYVKQNDEYKAVGFIFKSVDNKCHIFKIEYEGDDIEKGEIASISRSSVDEFKNFCKEKYKENFSLIENDIKQEIIDKYPQYKGDFFNWVVNDVVQKEKKKFIESAPLSLDQAISKAREDASLLAKSYIERPQKENER